MVLIYFGKNTISFLYTHFKKDTYPANLLTMIRDF